MKGSGEAGKTHLPFLGCDSGKLKGLFQAAPKS